MWVLSICSIMQSFGVISLKTAELCPLFGLVWYGLVSFGFTYHSGSELSFCTTMQNLGLLAQKINKLWLGMVCFGMVLHGLVRGIGNLTVTSSDW